MAKPQAALSDTGEDRAPSQLAYPGVAAMVNDAFAQRAAAACIDLCQRLTALDAGAIGVSEYNQRYIRDKLRRRIEECSLLVYAMHLIMGELKDEPSKLSFVDFGGGFGFNSLVARYLGFRKVFYCDIYDVSAEDARRIGHALNQCADAYVAGEMADLITTVVGCGETCDAFISTDTIEHIYDVGAFFRQLCHLPTQRLAICLTSHANQRQPRTRRILGAQARRAEFQDREKQWGHKERDAVRSFLTIRREMITAAFPSLRPDELDRLAALTRGLRQEDIIAAVRRYVEEGTPPAPPAHPTNTCDPYTGNWAEQLMDPVALAKAMQADGLAMRAVPGYWPHDPRSSAKQAIKTLVNRVIAATGTLGLRMSPNYILIGTHVPAAGTMAGRSPARAA